MRHTSLIVVTVSPRKKKRKDRREERRRKEIRTEGEKIDRWIIKVKASRRKEERNGVEKKKKNVGDTKND